MPMLNLLVVAIGFSCLTPGVAIASFGTVGLQPIMPLLALYCIFVPLSLLRLPMRTLQWAMANVAGLLLSYFIALVFGRGDHEDLYLILQSVLYLGAAAGFGTILVTPAHRRMFVESYVAAALISSGIGIIQAILSQTLGIILHVTNNANFSLIQDAAGRAAAFAPEASVLATLLLPAFVCVWLEHEKPDSLLRPLLRSRSAQALLLAGLIATRSSTLLLLPVLLLLTEAFCSRNWKEFVAFARRSLAALAVAGALFLPVYTLRLQTTDARASGEFRKLNIHTALRFSRCTRCLEPDPAIRLLPPTFRNISTFPATWHF